MKIDVSEMNAAEVWALEYVLTSKFGVQEFYLNPIAGRVYLGW